MRRHLAYALELIVVPIAAAIVFVEQTLFHYLNAMTAALARWPPIARLEALLVRLPPWAAVCTFACAACRCGARRRS